ncbi:hypothetical protein [Sodalis sp. dw_96]|uniref:OspG family effector kinase n=1 Tax=Sodalis sp. dw_96 TaxID=2719794 RepID=UPI001BD4711D|nr:hypothetical protein [Sodalis sp. dw_96]
MPISAAGHRKNIGVFENKYKKYTSDIIIQKTLIGIANSQQEKVPLKPNGMTVLYVISAVLPHLKMIANTPPEARGGLVLYNGVSQNAADHKGASEEMAARCNIRQGSVHPPADCRVTPALNNEISNSIYKEITITNNIFFHLGQSTSEFLIHPVRKLGELVAKYDPLRFPSAGATPASSVALSRNPVYWDKNSYAFIVEDEFKKKEIIESLANFLIATRQLTEPQIEQFETLMKESTSGFPITITPVMRFEGDLSRTKRISEADRNRYIDEHIKEHCAFETEVLNTKGENEGKVLIFQAQRAENPFRMMYDNTDEPPSPLIRGVSTGLNFFADIMTLGLKPLIGNIVANSLRKKYYLSKGDDICATRQDHLSIAELATAINVEGLSFARRGNAPVAKPRELMHSIPIPDRAAYSLRNPATGIQQELLINVVDKRKTAGAIRDGENITYLKPTGQGEFVTYHPRPAKPELAERKVIVNEETLTWRYADDVGAADLNVHFSEGKAFVHLQGEKYELRMNRHRQYEIVVHKSSGATEHLPVYREPLSRKWHLVNYNAHPAFNTRQQNIINEYHTPIDEQFKYVAGQNENEKRYGAGIIYRVEKIDDPSNEILHTSIEMNGMLVPVRERITAKKPLHYEIYHIDNVNKETYPVEFDGARWLFERPTSVHASNTLKNAVTRDMLTDVDASQLSAPGYKGLRWDAQDKSYLKVENKYLEIKKLNGNRYCIKAPFKGKRTYLRYNNERFSIETTRERLNNIITEGLSGRKRTHALDILKEQDGFTEDSARRLLQGYQFPKNGFYDDYNFALEIEQTGQVPQWANKFKKSRISDHVESAAQKTVSVFVADQPEHLIELKMGEKIGEGSYGKVFIDAGDNNYVIKKYVLDDDSPYINIENLATNESDSFRRYYGEGSAKIYHDGNEDYYMRMYRVPGKTLQELPANVLPPDAVERYVDMLEKLNHVGILHSDLHEGNIMWDEEAEIFNPIDIYNIKDQYFSRGAGDSFQDEIDEEEWGYLIEDIIRKMKSDDQV